MCSKIMVLAATASFIALTAPHSAAFAQTPGGGMETLEDIKQRCREDRADDAFRDGQRYVEQANVESRQAADYDELRQNALDNADAASSAADKAMWNADAKRYEGEATRLRGSANRNLDRANTAYGRFIDLEPCKKVSDALMEYMIGTIELGEMLANPTTSNRKETQDEVEPAPQKEKEKKSQDKKSEKKKPTKVEKIKKQANTGKFRNKANKVAERIARDVVVNVATGLILDQLVGGRNHRHGRDHGRMGKMPNPGQGKHKEMRRLKKMKQMGLELF